PAGDEGADHPGAPRCRRFRREGGGPERETPRGDRAAAPGWGDRSSRLRPREGDPVIRKTYRSSRGPASPRPARDVMRLSPYAAPATGRREFLRLDLNENLRGCAPGVVERLRSIGAEDLTVYPEETGARAAVARRFGIAPPLDLVLCAGADEGIRLVCDAFVE